MTVHKKYMHPEIELCRNCKGSGILVGFNDDDVLHQEPVNITCDVCNGSGRVIVSKEIFTKVIPFKNNNK